MKDIATKPAPTASSETFDLSPTVNRVESFLSSQGIVLDDTQEPMFRNHIDALKRRMETGKFIEGLEDAFGEVSSHAFELAREVAQIAYGDGSKGISESEFFLLATHIEVALRKEEK